MASKKNTEVEVTEVPAEETAPKVRKSDPKPCQCFTEVKYFIGDDASRDYDGSEPDATPVYGPCGAETKRVYAPGHDARLKGVLIKLHLAGKEYVTVNGGLLISVDPAIKAAELGWSEFLVKAKEAAAKKETARLARVEAATKRNTEKAKADQAKTDQRNLAKSERAKAVQRRAVKQADPAVVDGQDSPVAGFHPVRIKVGRKVHDGNIVAESTNEVTVSYTDGRGNARTAVVKRADLVS